MSTGDSRKILIGFPSKWDPRKPWKHFKNVLNDALKVVLSVRNSVLRIRRIFSDLFDAEKMKKEERQINDSLAVTGGTQCSRAFLTRLHIQGRRLTFMWSENDVTPGVSGLDTCSVDPKHTNCDDLRCSENTGKFRKYCPSCVSPSKIVAQKTLR